MNGAMSISHIFKNDLAGQKRKQSAIIWGVGLNHCNTHNVLFIFHGGLTSPWLKFVKLWLKQTFAVPLHLASTITLNKILNIRSNYAGIRSQPAKIGERHNTCTLTTNLAMALMGHGTPP
jgi:hypothetical protein